MDAAVDTFLDKTSAQRVFEQTDESLRTLVKIMLPKSVEVDHYSDHHIGFCAIDAMYDDKGQQVKKLIDFNTNHGC
jgi:hypothetical protein